MVFVACDVSSLRDLFDCRLSAVVEVAVVVVVVVVEMSFFFFFFLFDLNQKNIRKGMVFIVLCVYSLSMRACFIVHSPILNSGGLHCYGIVVSVIVNGVKRESDGDDASEKSRRCHADKECVSQYSPLTEVRRFGVSPGTRRGAGYGTAEFACCVLGSHVCRVF